VFNERISVDTPFAGPRNRLGRRVLFAVIVGVSLFQTKATLAQENREAVCMPAHVTVARNAVHLQCTADVFDSFEVVRIFAVPAADPEFADRFLNTANAALVGGRPLLLKYQARSWSAPLAPGCDTKDCRLAMTISIR
jgi:hypothetical protein